MTTPNTTGECVDSYHELERRVMEAQANHAALQVRVDMARNMCRRHEHPGCSAGVHEFAAAVRKLLEGTA